MRELVEYKNMIDFAHRIRAKNPLWEDISIKYISKQLNVSHKKTSKMFSLFKKYGTVKFVAFLDTRPFGFTKIITVVVPNNISLIHKLGNTVHNLKYVDNISLVWSDKPSYIIRANVPPLKINKFMENLKKYSALYTLPEPKIIASTLLENGKFLGQDKPLKPIKLDKYNLAILKQIREDASLTYQELGDKIGLTAPAAYLRLKRLKEFGIIKGYFCIFLDENVTAPISTILSFCFLSLEKDKIVPFINDLLNNSKVELRNVYELYGNLNLLCDLGAKNTTDLYKFIDDVLTKYNISNMRNEIVLKQWWRRFPFEIEDFKFS